MSRSALSTSLARARTPALAALAAALWRDGRLLPNERLFLVLLRDRPEARRRGFEQVRASLDEVVPLVPANLPLTASDFCDAGGLDEARALFEPALERYPSLRLTTANVLERIQLCIAERAAERGAAAVWFRARAAQPVPGAPAAR